MTDQWYTGNAADDGSERRGWILGHFIDPSEGVRHSKDVEVKWGTHPAGETRPEWAPDHQRTTLVLLIQGKFHVHLTDGSALLQRQGDYLVWGPGVEHSWEAEEDSIVVTVRWPSLPS